MQETKQKTNQNLSKDAGEGNIYILSLGKFENKLTVFLNF
jgi:hypothetical protein